MPHVHSASMQLISLCRTAHQLCIKLIGLETVRCHEEFLRNQSRQARGHEFELGASFFGGHHHSCHPTILKGSNHSNSWPHGCHTWKKEAALRVSWSTDSESPGDAVTKSCALRCRCPGDDSEPNPHFASDASGRLLEHRKTQNRPTTKLHKETCDPTWVVAKKRPAPFLPPFVATQVSSAMVPNVCLAAFTTVPMNPGTLVEPPAQSKQVTIVGSEGSWSGRLLAKARLGCGVGQRSDIPTTFRRRGVDTGYTRQITLRKTRRWGGRG